MLRSKALLQKLTLVLLCLITSFVCSGAPVAALSQDAIDSINNNTAWYDPSDSATDCSALSGDITTASSGLSSDLVNTINKLKPVYQQAATQTNVPWQLLAAIHYRETNLSTTEPNLFQITGYSGPSDLLSQAIAAGNFLQHSALSSNLPTHHTPLQQTGNDPEEIKDTIYSYNGRADAYAKQAQQLGFNPSTQPYEGSPYVMNNYDAIHHDMGIITGAHGPDTIDGVDTRFGAFAVYSLIGGAAAASSTGGCTATGAVAGNAVQTAINYAWPEYHAAPYTQTKPAYATAITKAVTNGEYVGGLPGQPGIDCGGFVTRVMRDSGADPNYNWGPKDPRQGPTTSQQAYMDAHPEKYQRLGPQNDTSQLQPGDIAINSEHTYMYVGKQQGFNGNSASASVGPSSARAPMASNAYFTNDAGSFIWYRLIKAG